VLSLFENGQNALVTRGELLVLIKAMRAAGKKCRPQARTVHAPFLIGSGCAAPFMKADLLGAARIFVQPQVVRLLAEMFWI